ncbi:MAG: hypothetical protein ABIU05_10480, partial [Nitrospirales bacterium]
SEEGYAASIEPRLSGTLKASNEAITHHNLGLILLSRQDKAAANEFRAAIQISHYFSGAYIGLGHGSHVCAAHQYQAPIPFLRGRL